jgi:hypothetical protein
MGDVLFTYVIPGGVSLYGLLVLVTGEVSGLGARTVRGTAGRVLGVVLLSAFPLALSLGSFVRIQLFAPKPNLTGHMREAEITRDILEQHRQLSDWSKENQPKIERKAEDDETRVDQRNKRRRALDEFSVQYKRKSAEADARIKELKDEQARLRQDREAAQEKQKESTSRDGPMWVAVGILICVWFIAWLFGKQAADNVQPSQNGDTPKN